MSRATYVIIDTCFKLVGPDCPVGTTLSYTSGEPFAVFLAFRVEPRKEIEWMVSRELLEAGLMGRAGGGDVVIRPMRSRPGHVEVQLRSPTGHAVFAAPADTLRAFLDDTYRVVPLGGEMDDADLDAELASIIADSSPEAEGPIVLPALVPAGPDEEWLSAPLGVLDFEYAARCQCAVCECNAGIGEFVTWADARAAEKADEPLCRACRQHHGDGPHRG